MACSHCLRTLLQPAQLARAPGAYAILAEHLPQPPPVPCARGCTAVCPLEVYCSPACRDAAWSGYHASLCPGDGADAAERPLPRLYALCAYDIPAPPNPTLSHPGALTERVLPGWGPRRLRRTNPMMVARSFAIVRQQLDASPDATVVGQPHLMRTRLNRPAWVLSPLVVLGPNAACRRRHALRRSPPLSATPPTATATPRRLR